MQEVSALVQPPPWLGSSPASSMMGSDHTHHTQVGDREESGGGRSAHAQWAPEMTVHSPVSGDSGSRVM